MMDTDLLQPSGEERLRKRNNAWSRYLVVIAIAFLLGGFVSGKIKSLYAAGTIPIWAPIVTFAVLLIALAWFSRDYFRRLDELDLMDNLWAHLVGQYVTIIAFMGWYFLADLGFVRFPAVIAIVCILVLSTVVTYFLRKLGWR